MDALRRIWLTAPGGSAAEAAVVRAIPEVEKLPGRERLKVLNNLRLSTSFGSPGEAAACTALARAREGRS